MGYGIGIFENKALDIGEIEISSIVVEIGDLLGRDPGLSANGRTDVNSKGASDESGDAEFGKPLQFVVHQMAAHLGSFHLHVSPEDFRMMCGHLNGHNDPAEAALSHGVDDFLKQPAKWAALIDRCTGNAGHQCLLLSLIG
jgi:hypothetical protein